MLHFICLILLASGFIVAQEKHLLCRTTDMELFYNSCGSSTETFFFEVEPCYLNGFSKWNGTIFWIPKRDLTFLRVILTLRHKTKKVIEWRHVACTGEDDEYTYCGALKGETINTTVRMSGDKVNIPMGKYTATLKGYSGHSEADLFVCVNFTLILKKEPAYNFR
uniref:lymphocyte antigen 96 n=1 Tax=Euleptes europaea TaxID=460621 RepID=UPI00254199C1|nr:lymphocyte antigen 96 [Euleptes europaea]